MSYSISYYNNYPIYSTIYTNELNTDNINCDEINANNGNFNNLTVLNDTSLNNLTVSNDAYFSKNINCDLDIYCRNINASNNASITNTLNTKDLNVSNNANITNDLTVNNNASITKKLDIGDNLIVGPINTLTTNSLYNIINGQNNNNETNTGDYINNSTIIGSDNKVNNIKDSLVIGSSNDLSNLAFYNNFMSNIVLGQNHQIQSSGNSIYRNIIGGEKLITNNYTKNIINSLIMCEDTEIYGICRSNGIFGQKHKLNLDTNNIGNTSNLISGYHNILTYCYYNNIGGANNTLTQANYNCIFGNLNELNSSMNNLIGGNTNKASYITNSLIIGKNYNLTNITSDQNFQNNILSGEGSTFRNGGTSIKNNIISGNNITTYNDTQNMVSNLIMSDNTRIRGKTKNNIISGWFHDLQKDDNNHGITGNLITGYQHTLNSIDYNLIGGHTQTVEFSYQNIIEGKNNKIYNSQNSLFIGANFDLSNTTSSRIFERNILSGYGHIITGYCRGNIIGGYNHTLDIGSLSAEINYNIIGGDHHTIKYSFGNSINGTYNTLNHGNYNNISGRQNNITSTDPGASSYNNISGRQHTIKDVAYNIIGGQENNINNVENSLICSYKNILKTTTTTKYSIIYGNQVQGNSGLIYYSNIGGYYHNINANTLYDIINGEYHTLDVINNHNIINGHHNSIINTQSDNNLLIGNNNKLDGTYISDGIVLGKYNEPNLGTNNKAYLIVGNGSDDNNRKNDFVIYQDGNTYTKNLTINTSKTIINTTGPKISTHIDEDIITTKYYVDTHLPICLKVVVQWSYRNIVNEWSYPTNTSNYMTISGNSLLSGNYIYITGLIPSPLAHPEPSGQNPNDKRIRINKIYMFNTPNGDLVGIPSNRYGGTFTSLCSLTNSLYGNSLLCFHLNDSAYDLSRENPIAGSYENDFTINENYSLWTFNIMNLEFLLQ